MKPEPWHALDIAAICERLRVDAKAGLTSAEAAKRLAEGGPNELREAPPASHWGRLFDQFREPVILVLVAAAVVSGALGQWTDAFAIIAIVLINGVIGF